MSINDEYLNSCPKHVAIIGGGRWARVLSETVSKIVPKSTIISIYSPHNAKAMSVWALEKNFEQDIYAYSDFSKLESQQVNVAIVVNAARDHAPIIEKILQMGVPVLVEKPVTLSYASTRQLAKLANAKKILFASAHVFLFARYVDNFSQIVSDSGKVKSIYVDWVDPKSESRYGESKLYDQGLPIFYDWLPHVLSVVSRLTDNTLIQDIRLDFYKGGSHVEIKFMLGDVFCHINLIRNGDIRQRVFKVNTNQELKLDFSNEPGSIHNGPHISCGDEKWDIEKRPAAQMLSMFLVQAAGGNIDKRLDIDIGLRANKLIDRVESFYNQALLSWLKVKLVSPVLVDTDLEYALKEIILFDGYFSTNIDTCIENIKQVFSGKDTDKWHNKISKSKKPFDIIRLIAFSKS